MCKQVLPFLYNWFLKKGFRRLVFKIKKNFYHNLIISPFKNKNQSENNKKKQSLRAWDYVKRFQAKIIDKVFFF